MRDFRLSLCRLLLRECCVIPAKSVTHISDSDSSLQLSTQNYSPYSCVVYSQAGHIEQIHGTATETTLIE